MTLLTLINYYIIPLHEYTKFTRLNESPNQALMLLLTLLYVLQPTARRDVDKIFACQGNSLSGNKIVKILIYLHNTADLWCVIIY